MEALLAFTTHSSQVRWLGDSIFYDGRPSAVFDSLRLILLLQFLKSSTLATWGCLFRHEALSKEAVVVEMAVKYLKVSMTNLVKVRPWFLCCRSFIGRMAAKQDLMRVLFLFLQTGFPSRDDNPSCGYSRVDFDSDEDFNFFFNCKSCGAFGAGSVICFVPWCFSMSMFTLNSFSGTARRGGEECMSNCSSGGFPDSNRVVTVSSHQSYWSWGYHM